MKTKRKEKNETTEGRGDTHRRSNSMPRGSAPFGACLDRAPSLSLSVVKRGLDASLTYISQSPHCVPM